MLAADANLTALAKQLEAAGAGGTLDGLRATIYLALLTGTPATALLPTHPTNSNRDDDRPANPDDRPDDDRPANPDGGRRGSAGDRCGDGDGRGRRRGQPGDGSAPATAGSFGPGVSPGGFLGLGGAGITGRVNLTLPLATWLGRCDAPGHAAGYGPLDATDARTLTTALAAQAGTQWCLTLTGPDGRPLAHGCARTGPPHSPPDQPTTRTRDRPGTQTRDRPGTRRRPGPRPAPGPGPGAAAGPEAGSAMGSGRSR